jgi:hypothetical protein
MQSYRASEMALDNGNCTGKIPTMNQAIKDAIAEMRRYSDQPGSQSVLNVGRQLPEMGNLLASIAQEQADSAAKLELQTNELIAMTGQLVSMTKRVVFLTRLLVWLTVILALFTVALFWLAFVQTRIMLRENTQQPAQYIENQSEPAPSRPSQRARHESLAIWFHGRS